MPEEETEGELIDQNVRFAVRIRDRSKREPIATTATANINKHKTKQMINRLKHKNVMPSCRRSSRELPGATRLIVLRNCGATTWIDPSLADWVHCARLGRVSCWEGKQTKFPAESSVSCACRREC